ncbi:MAG: diguanylate cyclase domain-containing protein [Leptolyngbyaceae cyanobacterium]
MSLSLRSLLIILFLLQTVGIAFLFGSRLHGANQEIFGLTTFSYGLLFLITTGLGIWLMRLALYPQELIEWRDRYDIATWAGKQVIYEYNLACDRYTWGRNAQKILGCSPDALPYSLPESIKFIHPADRRNFLRLLKRTDSVGPFSLEFRFRKQDGTYIWLEDQGMPQVNSKGQIVKIIGSLKDISDRKRIEQELQESKAKFQRLVDDIGDKFVIFSHTGLEGRMTYVSGGFQAVFGSSKEQLIGRPWEQIINWLPEDIKTAQAAVIQLAETLIDFQQFEMRFLHPQKGLCIILVSQHPVRDKADQLIAVEGIVEDITDRKQAEMALKESESTLRQITENLPLLFGLRPLDYSLWLYINASYETVTGYPVQTLYDDPKYWQKFIHPDDLPTLIASCVVPDNIRETDQTFRLFRADGEMRWIHLIEFPVYNQQQEPYRVVVFAQDITEQKRSALELQKLNDQLQELATTDSLTQIANRRQFLAALEQEWKHHQRENLSIAFMMIDIDHFKAYNDRYGHPAGDACLVRVADKLKICAHRTRDLVARYGGEEFVVLLPSTNRTGAVAVAQRLQDEIAAMKIPNEDASTHPFLTLSLGIAVVNMPVAVTSDTVIAQADAALYQAKQTRNTFQVIEIGPCETQKS